MGCVRDCSGYPTSARGGEEYERKARPEDHRDEGNAQTTGIHIKTGCKCAEKASVLRIKMSSILCEILDVLLYFLSLFLLISTKMKVAGKIKLKISRMEERTTFGYEQLGIDRTEYGAAAKAIERLLEKGTIKRISTGVFYKPKSSPFGQLQPGEQELLKPYLFEQGKRIAYITGGSLYNRMGFTTQVPKVIKVASRLKRISTRIGKTQVRAVKSYVDVTDENYYLLELLDVLKDFKTIPDLDKQSALMLLKDKINGLPKDDLSKLLNYALNYPPRARALLGALLEVLGKNRKLSTLRASLNPLTAYDLGIGKEFLPTALNWNIR